MKKLSICLILISLISLPLFAQEDFEDAYDSQDSASVKGFLCPSFAIYFPDTSISFIGGGGGLVLWDYLIVGGYYSAMTDYYKTNRGIYNNSELDLGAGGLLLGLTTFPSKRFHFSLYGTYGFGGISLSNMDKIRIKDAYDKISLINGIINFDYDILKFLSIGIGGCYQQALGVDLDGYYNSEFSGPGMFFCIKIKSY